jgi:hypothetical protein
MGGARGEIYAYTSSRETLATREVLAHPHTVFHSCMCELREDAIVVVVVVALIGYNDLRLML